MNVALRLTMTLQQYLDWEERQATKHEFDGVAPVAMTGARAAHVAIAANLVIALGIRLRGGPCRVYGSDLKLRVGDKVRYPDAMVICGAVAGDAVYVSNPTAVFEVLSASTAHIDRFEKAKEYWTLPSIRHYVILEQTKAAAVTLERGARAWRRRPVGATGTIGLAALSLSLPMSELYAGCSFYPPPA